MAQLHRFRNPFHRRHSPPRFLCSPPASGRWGCSAGGENGRPKRSPSIAITPHRMRETAFEAVFLFNTSWIVICGPAGLTTFFGTGSRSCSTFRIQTSRWFWPSFVPQRLIWQDRPTLQFHGWSCAPNCPPQLLTQEKPSAPQKRFAPQRRPK